MDLGGLLAGLQDIFYISQWTLLLNECFAQAFATGCCGTLCHSDGGHSG
jgi:hypothetical protein